VRHLLILRHPDENQDPDAPRRASCSDRCGSGSQIKFGITEGRRPTPIGQSYLGMVRPHSTYHCAAVPLARHPARMPIGPIASPTGSSTMLITLCLLIGIVAGLRAFTAPAAVSWAAHLGMAPPRQQLARLSRLSLHALDRLGARIGRIGRRPASHDAQPQGAAAVHHPAPDGRGERRRDRPSSASSLLVGLAAGVDRRGDRHAGWRGIARPAGGSFRQRSSGGLDRGRDRGRRRGIDRACSYEPREIFDAIIVGAGQAGPALAGRLTDAGQTVALIERGI
jgi:hypothetical protein